MINYILHRTLKYFGELSTYEYVQQTRIHIVSSILLITKSLHQMLVNPDQKILKQHIEVSVCELGHNWSR